MKQSKNLWVIPTDKPSRIAITDTDVLGMYKVEQIAKYGVNQNIYITNSEEIKEGDWFVVELFKITGESDGLYIEKCTKLDDVWCNNFDVISTRHKDNCKKIILTTDQDLIKDGIQSIDDEFLEWFVKNPSCEEVEIKPMLSNNGRAFYGYKIIIPKEEVYFDFTGELYGFPKES
jgi:hypothetical protein